jgi:dTDP-4-dehydrorhamnose reductase
MSSRAVSRPSSRVTQHEADGRYPGVRTGPYLAPFKSYDLETAYQAVLIARAIVERCSHLAQDLQAFWTARPWRTARSTSSRRGGQRGRERRAAAGGRADLDLAAVRHEPSSTVDGHGQEGPSAVTRKVLVSGLAGTVGRALKARLDRDSITVIGWDRSAIPIDRYRAMDAFVAEVAPDVLIHLAIASSPTGRANESWLVNYEWPSELAWICRQRDIRFVHASTAMVFSGSAKGPFTLDSIPDATEGYGREKRMAEARVFHQNPNATVVRLGWQIGDRPGQPGTNNMIDFFDRKTREHGHVPASSRWFPACSFLADTADAIVRLLPAAPGLYQLDGNERWTFLEIARALAAHHGGRWTVVETDDLVQDQRMIDPRAQVASLKVRLPALP